MFRQILYTQWKWSRLVVLLLTLVGFAIPVLSVRPAADYTLEHWEARALLNSIESWGVLYPLLAAAAAVIMAMATWGPDHHGHHVYALSLPLPRWHYALLRFGAGAILLAAPVVAVWLGALVGTASAVIPPGLHAYPQALALRFGLALLLAYSVFFAISAGTVRTAGYVLGLLAALVVIQVMASVANVHINVLEWILNQVYIWPGPLEIFTGRWMLIDV